MTRIQTLENRLERLQDKKESYILSEKIAGKLYANPKAARYSMTCVKIKRELRTLQN